MAIFTRIKIIEFVNKKDAETKLNQFLSSNPDICMLVDTSYNWEQQFILVEYRAHNHECIEAEDEMFCQNQPTRKPNIITRVWNFLNERVSQR